MPSNNGQNRSCLQQQISVTDLGVLLAMSQRTIERLENQRVLKRVTKPRQHARYVLGKVVPAYVEHLRKSVEADPHEASYTAARARRMVALARKEELALATEQGVLHRADDIEFAMTQMLTSAKMRLMAIPSRITRMLIGQKDFQKIYTLIDGEIRTALTELSEAKYKDSIAYRRAQGKFLKGRVPDDELFSNGKGAPLRDE